jgi:hypothetical protein
MFPILSKNGSFAIDIADGHSNVKVHVVSCGTVSGRNKGTELYVFVRLRNNRMHFLRIA